MNVDVVARSPSALPCAEVHYGTGAPCAPANRKWVLVATILGSALAFMDGSVVNVALPTLQAAFHATGGGIQWVVQGYALFGAALLLLGGAIGDHYGRRRTYCWGVALFAVASAGCAASTSLGQLVAARTVQGVGAALLVPQGLSILSASFSGEERGRAIGTWSAWTSVFGALGPVAGGWLLQVWSWRLIFVLNLPLAALVLLLAPRIPESKSGGEGEARPLDWLGALLATGGFASTIFALSFAPELGWRSVRVVVPLLIGGLLLAAFLWSQGVRVNAMMPLSLFRIPRFLAANLLTFLLYGALGGGLYVIPFYVIQVRHYAPVEAGAVFLPLVAMMFFFSARVGAMAARVGERWLLAGGALCAGVGFGLFAMLSANGAYWRSLLPGVLLLGVGMTLAVAPLTTAVMSSVPQEKTGVASAVNNALSRLAALMAVSVLVFVLAHGFSSRLGHELARSNLPAEARQQMTTQQARLHETPIPGGLTEAQHAEAARVLDRSFFAGYRAVMLSCAVSAWLGGLAVVVLLRRSQRQFASADNLIAKERQSDTTPRSGSRISHTGFAQIGAAGQPLGIPPSKRVMDDWKLVPKEKPPEIEKAGEAALDASVPAKDRLTSRLASGLADRLVLKGTGPLPLIDDDPLVELLGKATNEELAPLVEILCTKGGVMCQLARTAAYRNNQPNHQTYVRDIAAEIQKFGANTLKTQLLRSGKGVPYDQIVRDVAGRVGVKGGGKSTREVEREIVTKLLMEAYETMSPEQRRELLLSLKIRDRKLLLAPGGVEAARLAIQHSGFAVYKGSVIVANAAAQQLLGHGLSLATNAALTKGIAVFAGPVGLVFAALLGGNALAAPARRVTVPIVLQVAAIRAVHEYHHETMWEQFVKWMRRHKWKIGIVVVLVCWLLFHLHVFR